jgi:hexokinase
MKFKMNQPTIKKPGTNDGGNTADSFSNVPSDLMAQIERFEELFTVGTSKLKEITDHFVSELKKGLTAEGGDIVSDNMT